MIVEYEGPKIFAIVDTHGMYRRLDTPADTDVLICVGDNSGGFHQDGLVDFFDSSAIS